VKRTERGFDILEITDRYGEKCSLQKSSLATEDCIWLGLHNPTIRAIDSGEEIPLPVGSTIGGRMHLTRAMVRILLPYLKYFAETGDLVKARQRKK
jgi:hypothetical protein